MPTPGEPRPELPDRVKVTYSVGSLGMLQEVILEDPTVDGDSLVGFARARERRFEDSTEPPSDRVALVLADVVLLERRRPSTGRTIGLFALAFEMAAVITP